MSPPRSVDHLFSTPRGEDFRVAVELMGRLASQGVTGTMWIDPRFGNLMGPQVRALEWSRPRGLAGVRHRLRRRRFLRRRDAAQEGRPSDAGPIHPAPSYHRVRRDSSVLSGELLHLHCLHDGVYDMDALFSSLPDGHPVVWTLHDAHALTGGCTWPRACERYREHCDHCPRLGNPGASDLAAEGFDTKARLYPGVGLHLVATTPHVADLAGRSALGRLARSVRTIANPHTLDDFLGVDRRTARSALSVPEDAVVVTADAEEFLDPGETARGWRAALERLAARGEIRLALLGEADLRRAAHVRDLIWIGPLSSDVWRGTAYALGDLHCAVSPKEEYPRRVLEALAAGTPVLATEHPSFSGRVVHERTGWLAPSLDAEDLERAVVDALAFWRSDGAPPRAEVRDFARRVCDPDARVAEYLELYEGAAAVRS